MEEDIKNIDREELELSKEAAKLIIEGEDDLFEIVEQSIIDRNKYGSITKIIAKRVSDEKYFESTFMDHPDIDPFDYEDPVFVQVFPKKKTVVIYE